MQNEADVRSPQYQERTTANTTGSQ